MKEEEKMIGWKAFEMITLNFGSLVYFNQSNHEGSF